VIRCAPGALGPTHRDEKRRAPADAPFDAAIGRAGGGDPIYFFVMQALIALL
jgi:hypothetical protein